MRRDSGTTKRGADAVRVMQRRAWMHLCILLVLLPAARGAASTDLVYLPDETDGVSALTLKRLGGWTEVLFRASEDEADEYALRETLLSPRINLALAGSVYHERFLSFNIDGTLSLERLRAKGEVTRSADLSFADYNGSAILFKHRAAKLDLFARRNNAWVDDHFQSSYRVRSSTVGAEFRTKGPYMPLALAYDHLRREEDFVGADRVEERDNVRISTSHRARLSQTDISFRYLDLKRNIQPQAYETVSGGFTNLLRRAPESIVQLRSYARYFNQYGSIRRRDLAVSEEASVRLTKDLQNSLRYFFSEQTGAAGGASGMKPERTRSHRWELGVHHTLYGSLSTALYLHGSRLAVHDRSGEGDRRIGGTERRGVRADLSYRRHTGIGRLRAGFGYEATREDQTSENRQRNVSNEEHVMRDGDGPFLDNRLVDVGSVIVTDESGFTVYQEGIDYRVEMFGSRIRLVRLPGGNIVDGQTVRVDYTFSFSPDLSFDTGGVNASFRLDSSRDVAVYYRYDREKEDFVSGVADGFLEDQSTHVAGVTWNWNSLSVGEEYTVNRLSASEFLTNRLFVDAGARLPHNTFLNLGGNYTRTRFTQAARTLNMFTINARFTTVVQAGLSLEGETWLRIDRGNPDAEGLDSDLGGARVKVVRQFRALTIAAGLFYRDANDNDVRDQRTSFFISARRAFWVTGR